MASHGAGQNLLAGISALRDFLPQRKRDFETVMSGDHLGASNESDVCIYVYASACKRGKLFALAKHLPLCALVI
jgi:6-phosphogluconolactonase (cycloisomerase 2 family)